MLYSQEVERSRKFLLALRIAFPIFALTSIVIFIILQNRSFTRYDIFLLTLTIFADVYFIFLMIKAVLSKKITDPISKTFDRENILKILQKDIDKKSPYVVALISIDNLIDINDRYGIKNGDIVLEKSAFLLDSFLKKWYKKVPIGHYKGGEFLIGISDNLKRVKEALNEFIKIYNKTKIDNIEIEISAILIDKNYSDSIEEIIEYLYQLYTKHKYNIKSKRALIAKKNSIKANEFEKFIIETIKSENLSLRFQPSLNLKSFKYDLVEVSVKLLDRDLIIHPNEFMPIINRLGFERLFDEILIKKVLETIEKESLPNEIYYSFNVSPFSIRDVNFREKILNSFDFSKNSIIFELFENRVYKDIDYYKDIIQKYRDFGVKFAFDNFGELNSSIEYIKHIKVDFIYFDKEYTKMVENKIFYNLLKNWISFFNKIETKTIVKFVDSQEKIDILKDIGVDYIQGYAISHPLDAKELKRFLKEKNEIW